LSFFLNRACYQFNGGSEEDNFLSKEIRTQKKSGWLNGLRLELFAGNPHTQQEYTFKSGMRVIVHNQTVRPFANEDGVDVPTSMQTNLAIRRTFVRHLPTPYSSCIDDTTAQLNARAQELKRLYLLNSYDQKFCIKTCIQNRIIDECGCYDPSYPIRSNSTVNGCESSQEVWLGLSSPFFVAFSDNHRWLKSMSFLSVQLNIPFMC
jgi:hypothetical protein